MRPTLDLNVLSQTVHDRGALLQQMARSGGAAAVIMDDPAFAEALSRAAPLRVVIHRRFRGDEDRLHRTLTPARFLDSVAGDGSAGVFRQCLNEPQTYDDVRPLVAWTVAVMEQAAARNLRLTVLNLAAGHPPLPTLANGAFDDLLRAFARWPQHVLGLHEYFRADPAREPDQVGRYRFWIARAQALGLPAPAIVITEAGRDVGGGHDGWRAAGWSPQDYAARLRAQAAMYRADGVPMCVFCAGTGFDQRWATFDIQRERAVLDAMTNYNAGFPEDQAVGTTPAIQPPPPGSVFSDGVAGVMPSSAVNVRIAPSTAAAIVTQLAKGAAVRYTAPATTPDWYFIQAPTYGWVSRQAGKVVFGPAVPDGMNAAELLQLAAELRKQAAFLRQAADQAERTAALHERAAARMGT